MEPNIEEVAGRIRALREDLDITQQEMADATGRTLAEYAAQESGAQDLSFTFLYKCAERLGVDVIVAPHRREPSSVGLLAHARGGRAVHQAPCGLRVPAQGSSFQEQAGRAVPGHRALPRGGAGCSHPPVLPRGPGARLHPVGQDALRLRGPYRGAGSGRSAHVRLRPRPRHDRHRRRAVHVPGHRHEAPRGRDYLGAATSPRLVALDGPRRASGQAPTHR